ncbi:hypothetical protein USDA257_c27000 [Sinorhizobium fredii USDA 257]|uniref:Uncharacterized protein n=2 Tax=Rhizobium fredii TaxID=380 RepID=I3X5W8_SINF2|nr:hypothetical protein USDA257_c27000 [Sinorhizobium fredii USDA 257]
MASSAAQQVQEDMALIAGARKPTSRGVGFAFSSITAWSRSTRLSSWVDRLQEVEHSSRGLARACG